MKKAVVLLLSMMLVCGGALAGCGSTDDTATDTTTDTTTSTTADSTQTATADSVENTKWKFTGAIDAQGQEVSEADFAAVYGSITYEFKAGGVLVAGTADTSSEGTWVQDGSTITVTSGGTSVDMTYDSGILIMENGGYTFTLEQE